MKISRNEFHISRAVRDACQFDRVLYSSTGNAILADLKAVRAFAVKFNKYIVPIAGKDAQISAGTLNAMGLLDEIFHFACMMYRKTVHNDSMTNLLSQLDSQYGKEAVDSLLLDFTAEFPPTDVYQGKISAQDYLAGEAFDDGAQRVRSNREATLEELIMLHLANENPAFKPFYPLFNDKKLIKNPLYKKTWEDSQKFYKKLPFWGQYNHDLITFLREPVAYAPDNLQMQLDYVRTHWADLLGDWLKRLLSGIDLLSEEWKPVWHPTNGGDAVMNPPSYENLMNEYERFSPDKDWMPKVVLMAKTVLVWLDQLSKKYGRQITRLDQIPDEELDLLRDEGFTGLWLIGLWERSAASKRIKQICGNPEAAASAYSLYDYEIAGNLGGWDALNNLRARLWQRGIRLASDMVPNHTGMDAKWVVEKPDLFLQRRDNPFPQYTFNGENLSHDSRVGVYLEDHYYSKTDCAVVFKRVDNQTGDTRYIYHGNDGTGMPWNDTAQIDFLNPAAREEVMQEILKVARNFPIIRFDAAMVLAKKHIRRLWYPEPGHGGDISTRSEYSISHDDFEKAIPNEFWREVVDRVAKEVPDTLLLAEAFWMMEGYFTRTLGMHRVYNSAFMNMLKKEENEKYRQTVKNTITFDPQILKRYVNFMNNPDEETAVAQFGKGDKYFGVCTLMVTMPGLPMFGHGQIEGFEEKYGMEYTKAYRDEKPDGYLVDRHWREIFPLIKKRWLFAEIQDFLFYDVWNNGSVNENVFAYSNHSGSEYALVFYNNKFERASGWIKHSCPYAVKTGDGQDDKKLVTRTIAEGLGLTDEDDRYLIFREQRANLWFIRKSSSIFQSGMFVALNGFESQVMMDMREEKDSADGRLRTLCNFLNGAGTPDLEIAWQELHYKDLYAAFANVVTENFIESVKNLFASDKELKAAKAKRPTVAKICAAIEENAIAFYNYANQIAEQESAGKKFKPVTAEKQFAAFKKILTLLSKAMPKTPQKKGEFPAKFSTSQAFLLSGANAEGSAQNHFVLLTFYGLVSVLAEEGFAAKWALYRKITEALKEHADNRNAIYGFLQRLFILAAEKLPSGERNQKKAAFTAVTALVNSKNAWILSGRNDFNNIAWFNKERADSSLWILTASKILTASASGQKGLLALYKTLAAAQKKAEYKCESWVKPFEQKAVKKAHAVRVAPSVRPRSGRMSVSEGRKAGKPEKAPSKKEK